MKMRLLSLCVFLVAAACSDNSADSSPYVRTTAADAEMGEECIDEDEDGYGIGCALGRDCDDGIFEVTDVCYRCAGDEPIEGCACTPGTEAVWCPPDEVADRHGEVQGGEEGVLKCSEGARYCRDGLWSECTGIGWVFQAY